MEIKPPYKKQKKKKDKGSHHISTKTDVYSDTEYRLIMYVQKSGVNLGALIV
jgi:hypothetical protein